MQIEVVIKLDPELEKLLRLLLEAIWDLAEIAGILTGYKVVRK